MQKIFIDSSTWVSFFAEDRKTKYAAKLFKRLFERQKSNKILLPRLVYLEVINNLIKLKVSEESILFFKNIVQKKKQVRLVKTREKIYINAEEYARKVRLKTLDLLILTEALASKVDKFITFDRKLRKAYYQLTQKQ